METLSDDTILSLPPTGAGGQTAITFPVTDCRPGEFVWYEAIAHPGKQAVVARGRFLVWFVSHEEEMSYERTDEPDPARHRLEYRALSHPALCTPRNTILIVLSPASRR
jgi:hypothetical protein